MRVRVPATRDMIEISRAEAVKATVRLFDELGELPPKPDGFEDIMDQVVVAIDPHPLQAIPTLAKGFWRLNQLGFEAPHNNTDVSF
jgi:hypothetical protein